MTISTLRPQTHGKARFGDSLVTDGERLLIGATARDEGYGDPAVCLYESSDSGWICSANFTRTASSQRSPFDDFGVALAIARSRVAVSAPGHEVGDGPVHVYEKSGGNWKGPTLIENPVYKHADQTYWSESLLFADDDLVVGQILAPLDSVMQTGMVHVFRRVDGTYREIQRLIPEDASNGLQFGNALAYDGKILAIGAPESFDRPGRVYLYARGSDGLFAQTGTVISQTPTPGGEFGSLLALMNDVLVVAAPGALGRKSGRIELFSRENDTFVALATREAPDLSWSYARAIAWDGLRLAVGDPGVSNRAGRVWRYEYSDGKLRDLGSWTAPDVVADEWLGSGLALVPGYLAVGAPSNTEISRFGRVVLCPW